MDPFPSPSLWCRGQRHGGSCVGSPSGPAWGIITSLLQSTNRPMAAASPTLWGPCLQDLLSAQARGTPDLTAVSFEDGASLTYDELHQRSNRLARVLRGLGVAQDVAVGVKLNRSVGLVVGIVSVIKAGGAYVAIDTCFPADRQAYILEDSGAKVLLVPHGMGRREPGMTVVEVGPMGEVLRVMGGQGEEEGGIADGLERRGCTASVAVDDAAGAGSEKSKAVEEEEVTTTGGSDPSSLAYILYTSGSTGMPKGVMIEHRGVVSLLAYFKSELGMGPGHTVLGLTTTCFDISVLELFLPLVTGARLCMVSSATQRDGSAIMEVMEREEVTLLQATPATYEMLMAYGWRGSPRVHCLCGGEAFRLNLLPLVQACASFRNGYGPTETTIYSTAYLIPKGPMDTVPIGEALWSTDLYILDEDMKPVAPGEAGELWIGGIGVARGYRNKPEMTAERFVRNVFVKEEGRMMYRTGDLCKWKSEVGGIVLYLGRMDSQVKLNGYRIELGEIEKVLQTHPSVGTAVVMCRDDCPMGRALVAYVKHASGTSGSNKNGVLDNEMDLRVHLSKAVPAYMVPRYFLAMDTFTLSPNGKIDRKALPAPSPPSPPPTTTSATVLTAPASECATSTTGGEGEDDEEDEEEEEEEVDVELGAGGEYDNRCSKPSSSHRRHRQQEHAGLAPLICRLVSQRSGMVVGPESSMTAVGLDSLGSAYIMGRLAELLGGLKVPPASLYTHDSVNEFALYLERRLEEELPEVLEAMERKEGFIRQSARGGRGRQGGRGGDKKLAGSKAAAAAAAGKHRRVAEGQRSAMLMDTLTGLRGLLILWVVFEHFMDRTDRYYYGYRLSTNTWLFCLLSGFGCLLQVTASTNARFSPYSFLKSRALGLFPIYYVAILLALPRYIALTTDPVAYAGSGWHKTGLLGTNYRKPATFVVDAVLYLTGMQTWIDEVNHRGLNTLYYASVQWNLYLAFAMLAMGWHVTGGRAMQALQVVERRLDGGVRGPLLVWLSLLAVTLCSLKLYVFLRPQVLLTFNPLLYVPAFLSGMATAYLYKHLERALLARTMPLTPFAQRAWAVAADLFAGFIIALVMGPWDLYEADRALCIVVIPAATAMLLLALGLQGPNSSPSIIKAVIHSDAALLLGNLSYPIYLFHESVGDMYMQMGVKGLIARWRGLLPPPGTPWPIKYQVFISPWMSAQSLILKLAALALAIVLGWLVQHYVIDKGMMVAAKVMDAWGGGEEGVLVITTASEGEAQPENEKDRVSLKTRAPAESTIRLWPDEMV